MAVTTVWMAVTVSLGCLRLSAAMSLPTSSYQSLLNVVSNIVEQDEFWAQAFDQGVYYRLDRSLYPQIVDEELLNGAQSRLVTVTADGAVKAADDKAQAKADGDDKGDAIRPMQFVRNVMRKRYRIGSVLQMAVEVLQKSLACLSYKHTVHLMKLIRVEISRKTEDRKSLKWSAKAIGAVAGMVIKMAALQLADDKLLQAAAFLDMYADSTAVVANTKGQSRREKYDLTPALDKINRDMLDFIGKNCVRAPVDERDVAKELHALITPSLYNPAKAKSITSAAYKDMFKSIMKKIAQLFDALPAPAGMTLDQWNEIMHFKRKANGDEMLDFIRIDRH